jgi:hypothetical protein
MTVPPADEAWLVAVHEAGHAVVDLRSGAAAVELWTNGKEGRCRPRGPTSAAGCLAGYVAEWRIDRAGELPGPEDFRDGAHLSDIRMAVARLGTDDPDRLLAAWIEAKTVIEADWPAVERIAADLRRRGRLTVWLR